MRLFHTAKPPYPHGLRLGPKSRARLLELRAVIVRPHAHLIDRNAEWEIDEGIGVEFWP